MRGIATLFYVFVNLGVIVGLSDLRLGGGSLMRFATVLALTFVATLIHELGHAWAVRAVGGRIKSIMVVPFHLRLTPRKLKLSPPAGGGDIGGYVAYTLDRIDPRRKHAIVATAGPAANVALTIVASIAATLLTPGQAPPGSFAFPPDSLAGAWVLRHQIADLAAALAVLSAGMAFLNLIPFAGSDGDHILYAMSSRYRRRRR